MASTTSRFRPYACPFCGREVRAKAMTLMGRTYRAPGRCECDGARAQRAALDAEARRAHAAELAAQRDALYRKAGIPRRFMEAAAPDPTYLPHVEAGHALYLVGDTHQGKTHAACALLKAYIDAHSAERYGELRCDRVAKIVNIPDLMGRLRATFDRRDIDEENVLNVYGGADLLVLDDLGKGATREWALERIFQVVNRRYEANRVTIVTTQYEAPDLGRRLAEGSDRETARAIVSRITDDTRRIVVSGRRCHG